MTKIKNSRNVTKQRIILALVMFVCLFYFSSIFSKTDQQLSNESYFYIDQAEPLLEPPITTEVQMNSLETKKKVQNFPGALMIPFSPLIDTAPVNDILVDPAGDVWIATESGLSIISGNNHTILERSQGTFPVPQAQALAYDGEKVWIGTLFGLFTINSKRTLEHVSSLQHLPSEIIWDLHWDGAVLWIATQNGLVFKNPDGKFLTINSAISNNGLRNNCINRILRFSEWVALSHDLGISCYNINFQAANPQVWKNIDHAVSGLGRPIRSLAFDGQHLWAATHTGLYFLTTPHEKLFSESNFNFVLYNKLQGLPSEKITALVAHRTGLWIGTNQGLARIKDQEIKTLYASMGVMRKEVRALFASGDILWIGTDEGVQFINMAGGQ